ncbi:peptidoglycan bridge formation glycyltransferase FemA/FemB family protein [Pseudonocardia eucalypti]|uniref:Peptidoglycan bridge formation glycyltransferase FemA/FemB family protein n=1 Tax=Pseudonocardia eucalypti TaxID=648755 RepID=A0ABP9Q6A3_9PSEU|nr:lipid II:glycine glycyltransferase (peptidoglycan interpeptide bridge formation enzyme) [Pseudonocardia eucalypti]
MLPETDLSKGTGLDRRTVVVTTTATRLDGDARLAWDKLVSGIAGSDVTQLSGWARVRAEVGYRALYLRVHRDGELAGGAQLLLRRIPLLGEIGYVSYGPLVAENVPREQVVPALVEALDKLARGRLCALFVQPVHGDDLSAQLLARGFRRSTAGVAPANTVRLDLAQDEDALRAALSKRIRRWTGKWERSGVSVRRGGLDDVRLLSDLIGRTATHQGFSELSEDYVRNLYEEFGSTGHAEIFVGEVDGTPVAAELFTACGGVLRCRLTGLDRSSPAVRLSVTSALDWEAMRWAKASGFAEFDLGGLSPAGAALVEAEGFSSQSLEGPDRFKVGFGGRLHRYPPAVELISSPLLRITYDRLRSAGAGRAVVEWVRTFMRQGLRRKR